MAHSSKMESILLGSDFQDLGLQGNLGKMKRLVDIANSDKNIIALSLAGDLADLHSLGEPGVEEAIEDIAHNLLQQFGVDTRAAEAATKQLVGKYPTIEALKAAEKENRLSYEDKAALKSHTDYRKMIKQLEGMATVQFLNQYVYTYQNALLAKLREGVQALGILGNNDTILAKKTLADRIRFLDDEKKSLRIGKVSIAGSNYTNFDGERLISPRFACEADDSPDLENSQIYKKLRSLGETPKLLVVHDSPHWISNPINQTVGKRTVVGLRRYIEQLKDDGDILLLQSGHSGRAGIYLYKNRYGKLILNVNTDSMGGKKTSYAKANYDNGSLKSVEMYKMAA